MAQITFHGNPVNTSGTLPATGSVAPDFTLTGQDLSDVTLSSLRGKRVILNIFPSIDTPVCQTAARRFNAEAAQLDNTTIVCISADLPFAAGRFCTLEGLKDVLFASSFRTPSFGKDYGIAIDGGPLATLLARAVVVIDNAGVVKYTELVPEISSEPNYAAALQALA